MHCPLCSESRALVVVERTPYEAIWRALAKDTRGDYTRDVIARNTPAPEATLVRCGRCDLAFFWPMAPGDASFYAALVAGDYFKDDLKWEFGWTLDRVTGARRVLDVGAGRGDFLSMARARGHDVFGVETDAAAAAITRGKGIPTDERLIESFSLEKKGEFDLVTSFHVLEHVADPLSFAKSMAACAKPGGRVVLSVPNRDRTYQPGSWGEMEPLEFPPHHVTRWSERALGELGRRAGLSVEAVAREPLAWDTAQHSLEKKIQARVRRRLGAVGVPLGAVLGFVASRALLPSPRLYDALRIGERAGAGGLAIVIVLRKDGG